MFAYVHAFVNGSGGAPLEERCLQRHTHAWIWRAHESFLCMPVRLCVCMFGCMYCIDAHLHHQRRGRAVRGIHMHGCACKRNSFCICERLCECIHVWVYIMHRCTPSSSEARARCLRHGCACVHTKILSACLHDYAYAYMFACMHA